MPAGGAIVNLSSSSAKLATTTEAAVYASSKTAVLSITRSFAYAFAPERRPGQRHLPGHHRHADAGQGPRRRRGQARHDRRGAVDGRNKTVPLGRAASADECAGPSGSCSATRPAYMTGQAINYTGGLVMW